MTSGRKTLITIGFVAAVLAVAAWWVLVNPDNAFTRLFARSISDVNARIVIGPYPSERDLRLLKANGVGLIVTLLDPAIPYEARLLEEEKARAAGFGIILKSFPMSSILGQKFGNYYDTSAAGAADAIAGSTEKVYLHCYLGQHRIQAVRDLLARRGIESGTYSVRKGERENSRLLLDSAEAAFGSGRYGEALDALAKIGNDELTLDATLLRAWCHLRLDQVAEAAAIFEAVLSKSPRNASAATGLGYCALRTGDLAGAERSFQTALTAAPDNADALGGLGIACSRSGRIEDAIRHLEASIRITPNAELQGILDRIRPAR
jgi:tetratricopeptide (TPR) repeat protein